MPVGTLVAGGGLVVAAPLTLTPWDGLAHAAGRVPTVGWILAIAGVALLAAGAALGVRQRRPAADDEPPVQVLPGWVVGAAIVTVTLAGAAAIWWLLAVAQGGTRQDHIDAVKTGLAVAGGVGAGWALLLAVRRQQLGERTQRHIEDDAAERRVTELYTKAADQLGHDKAAVRLAGLYALERLAQDNPAHRQTIVNVLCAYLRMPYTCSTEDATPDGPELARSREEFQVRHTAQDLLATHLRDEEYRGQPAARKLPSTHWPGMSLDLSGAHLDGFGLIDCRVDSLECHRTRFVGEAMFRGLRCGLAFFQGAIFEGHTDFRGLNVEHHAWFSYSTFATEVWFHTDEFYSQTNLGHHTDFRGATFSIGGRFNRATFSGSADFSDAEYEQGYESMNLDDVCIEDPNAVSPETGNATSTWPRGWVIQPREDGTATLVRRQQQTQGEKAELT